MEPIDFPPPRSGEREGVEVIARVQKDCFVKVLRGSGEFNVFSRPFYVRGVTCGQKRPASRWVRRPGSFEERENDWTNHPGSRLAQQGTWIANQSERFREGGWTDLHSRGSREVHGGQVGGDQPAPFVEQSSGAGILVGLHSGGDLQSREDTERHCSVNSASSPSQIAARLWVRAHLSVQRSHENVQVHSRSLCGQNLAKPRQRAKKDSKSWANVVRGDSMKDMTASPTRSTSNHCGKPSLKKGVDGHDRRWFLPDPGPGPQSSCNTAFSRVRFSADGYVKCWCRPSLTQVQNSTQVPVQISLSLAKNTTPPSWQTLPHSFRCSCHQCSRS